MALHACNDIYYIVAEYSLRFGGVVPVINLRRTCRAFCRAVDQALLHMICHHSHFFVSTTRKYYDEIFFLRLPGNQRWPFIRQNVFTWILAACVAFVHEGDHAHRKRNQRMFLYTAFKDTGAFYFNNWKQALYEKEFQTPPDAQEEMELALSERVAMVMPALTAQDTLSTIQMALKRWP